MIIEDSVTMAREIATKAHQGQFRRDGKTPYISHPQRVAKRLEGNPQAQAVAWLHDVLEDTSVTSTELRQAGLGEDIIKAVEILTKTRGVKYLDYLQRVKASDLARQVKIQDMLDNLSDKPSDKQIVKYARGFLVLIDS